MNFCSNVHDVGLDFSLDPPRTLRFVLPLAHVYDATLDYINIFQGTPLAYVESVDAVAQAFSKLHPRSLRCPAFFFKKNLRPSRRARLEILWFETHDF